VNGVFDDEGPEPAIAGWNVTIRPPEQRVPRYGTPPCEEAGAEPAIPQPAPPPVAGGAVTRCMSLYDFIDQEGAIEVPNDPPAALAPQSAPVVVNGGQQSNVGDDPSETPSVVINLLDALAAEEAKVAAMLAAVPENSIPTHGGATPADAEIIANSVGDLMHTQAGCAIIGREFDGQELEHKQVVGAVVAPIASPPNVYSNTSTNVQAAISERYTKKQKKCTLTIVDKKKIGRFLNEAMGKNKQRACFSKENIEMWAESHLHLAECVSSKWSSSRFEASLNNLLTEAFPEFMLKTSVKLENMPLGKAPRFLIADGDGGQLMALLTIKCFEDLLFAHFEVRSIKHARKREAVERCLRNMAYKLAKAIEGDGSAWDTTCNAIMRACCENPVLKHICEVLIRYGVVPAQWADEHLKCCEANTLKLFFQNGWSKVKMSIDAIRRSGHRGTSCLNWWVNQLHWLCAVYQEPWRFLQVEVRWGVDVTGTRRWWAGAFEGDDSLCCLFPAMVEGDALNKAFLNWWDRAGFHMKIVYATDQANFVGWIVDCDEGNPTGVICPDVRRCINNSGVSTSTAARMAVRDGTAAELAAVAKSNAVARAAEYAGLLPSVSRKFAEYAQEVHAGEGSDNREMNMRLGTEGLTTQGVLLEVEDLNAGVTPTQELALLKRMGWEVDPAELDRFVLYPWTLATCHEWQAYRESVPLSWRT